MIARAIATRDGIQVTLEFGNHNDLVELFREADRLYRLCEERRIMREAKEAKQLSEVLI